MKFAMAALALSYAFAAVPDDIQHNPRRLQEFTAFQPRYAEMKAERIARLRNLGKEVKQREAALKTTTCSHQIFFELQTLVTFSANFDVIDRRLGDLEAVLAHPEREADAEKQNPEDGMWGGCYQGWHLKLYASYDHRNDPGARPFRFLDRVNSPEKLTAYFNALATSDIARTGEDHAFELNESESDLLRMILRDQPKGYRWHPELKRTMRELLFGQLRNPETGWWGERYVRDGRAQFVDDLSMTFHAVSFMEGKVPDLPKVIDTALALKDVDTPAGWLWNGAYWNHNNMDVAVIFRYAWPEASAAQRSAMKAEIEKMLRWTLAETLEADGSFKPVPADGSLEEATYFGTAFLARLGYFDRTKRFWTTAEFPDAAPILARIVENVNRHVTSGGAGGYYYKSILEELPDVPAYPVR